MDVLLTERELARDFVAALGERAIPEKFFYWFPLSVRAWLALCGAAEYRNAGRSRAVMHGHAADIAELVPSGGIEVVSLGAGDGETDRLLLAALAGAGRAVFYRPVDASQALLEMALEGAIAAGHAARGVKADFAIASQLAAVRALPREGARLWLLLGNTMGGFDPDRIAGAVAAVLDPGDLALVDGELFAGAETLAGYDHPVNRRFAFAPLAAAGLREDDGALRFELARDERRDGVHRVEKHFTATRAVRLHVAGESLDLAAGDRIAMSPSHKYDERGYHGVLERAGLEPVHTLRSEDGRFLVTLARGTR